MQTLFIAFFAIAASWFGVSVFRTKSMMRSALSLLFSQTAVGAMFVSMQVEFLGVLQIMMMATEMSIMAIFMVMFMMDPGGLGAMDMTHQQRLSILVAVAGALATAGIAVLTPWGSAVNAAPGATEQVRALGLELLGRSMAVFETAGVTILTAMIAASAVALPALQRGKAS